MNKSPRSCLLSLEQLESREIPAGFSAQVADNIVTGLYHQLLHREPDAPGLTRLSNQLESGVTVRRVANQLWSSSEFHAQEITNYFQFYYGRTPSAAALNAWVQVLDQGGTEASVMARFLSSPEFSARHTSNADYVVGLYDVVLDRTPDTASLNAGVAALNSGTSRAEFAADFLDSNKFHRSRVQAMFTAILGRPVEAAELKSYLTLWNQPGVTIRTIELNLLSSAENVANLSNLVGASLASPLVTEYQLNYTTGNASTHEILDDPTRPNFYWITGQLHDALILFDANTGTQTEYPLPTNSRPHGMLFDAQGRFFVSLESMGMVAQIDPNTGAVLRLIDVSLTDVTGAPGPINASPHDIALGTDGETIWFTGKATGTVGKINPDGTINHYQLLTPNVPTGGSVPIYLSAGPDGNMWGTELAGNKIFRVTNDGVVTEFTIPTFNSRPIVIIPDPLGRQFMWFSEENGHKVAKIDMNGVITEYVVPKTQSNSILAGMAFDDAGNLYTQSYVNQNDPIPSGPDFIVKLSSDILNAPAGDMSNVTVTRYQVPSRGTVFHRIDHGSDGNMYFTELALDKVGRLVVDPSSTIPPTFSFNFGL